MKSLFNVIVVAFSVMGAHFVDALGGAGSLAIALVLAMSIDYFTGLACAAIWQKSPKSANGALESRAGIKGLFRKCGILLCIIMAAELSQIMNTFAIRDSTIIFFVCNETLSIIENLAIMGVPFPPAVKRALEVLKTKSDSVDIEDADYEEIKRE